MPRQEPKSRGVLDSVRSPITSCALILLGRAATLSLRCSLTAAVHAQQDAAASLVYTSHVTLDAQVALQGHFAHALQLPGGALHGPARRPGQLLSLAQRQKLVARPAKQLTATDWEHVRATLRQRSHACHECAICQEPFRDSKQVRLLHSRLQSGVCGHPAPREGWHGPHFAEAVPVKRRCGST